MAPRVLHLVHGWPPEAIGGTELYAAWLAEHQAKERKTFVLARAASPRAAGRVLEASASANLHTSSFVNTFQQRNPLSRNAISSRRAEVAVRRALRWATPDLVHVHHLAGLALSVLRPLKRSGLPLVLHLHDWWLLCPRANFLDSREQLCSGPAAAKCSGCLPYSRLEPKILVSGMLHTLRMRLAREWLRSASLVLAGSDFLMTRFRAAGLIPHDQPTRIVEYGVKLADQVDRIEKTDLPRAPLEVGFIGSILPHKGLQVLCEAVRDLPASVLVLNVWGDHTFDKSFTERAVASAGSATVRLKGRFSEREKPGILSRLDLLVVPSLGLESCGLVVREAAHCGTPVLASKRGALASIEQDGFGEAFDPQSPEMLRERLLSLAREPDQILRLRQRLPVVKSMGEHAREIDDTYSAVA